MRYIFFALSGFGYSLVKDKLWVKIIGNGSTEVRSDLGWRRRNLRECGDGFQIHKQTLVGVPVGLAMAERTTGIEDTVKGVTLGCWIGERSCFDGLFIEWRLHFSFIHLLASNGRPRNYSQRYHPLSDQAHNNTYSKPILPNINCAINLVWTNAMPAPQTPSLGLLSVVNI